MSTLQSELPSGSPPDLLSSSNQVAFQCSATPTSAGGRPPGDGGASSQPSHMKHVHRSMNSYVLIPCDAEYQQIFGS